MDSRTLEKELREYISRSYHLTIMFDIPTWQRRVLGVMIDNPGRWKKQPLAVSARTSRANVIRMAVAYSNGGMMDETADGLALTCLGVTSVRGFFREMHTVALGTQHGFSQELLATTGKAYAEAGTGLVYHPDLSNIRYGRLKLLSDLDTPRVESPVGAF